MKKTHNNKVVSLTVHKNNSEKRKQRDLRSRIVRGARKCANLKGVKGYAIVVIGDNFTDGYWYAGPHNTSVELCERLKNLMYRVDVECDREDS